MITVALASLAGAVQLALTATALDIGARLFPGVDAPTTALAVLGASWCALTATFSLRVQTENP